MSAFLGGTQINFTEGMMTAHMIFLAHVAKADFARGHFFPDAGIKSAAARVRRRLCADTGWGRR